MERAAASLHMRKTSDLSDIHTFVAISEAGTLRAAAESLGVPTSTVSRSLKRLENSLDLLLVRRTPHGITLTDSGKQYLMSCRRALRILREGAIPAPEISESFGGNRVLCFVVGPGTE